MRDLPSLKAIRVFEACIRLGSFTKAARELNVGQPAVSHQIQALEQDLGVLLFDRNGGQTVPTAEAQAYWRSVSSALDEIARSTRALRQRARQPGLTLATYPGIAMFWLMPKLSTLKQTEPDLAVRVVTSERDQDIPLDGVDCAILFGDGDWLGFESHLLMPEIVVPIASPSLAARLQERSREAILEKGPLIHLEDRDRRWFTWQDWRDQRAAKALQIEAGIKVTNHGIAIHETLTGHGISLGWMGVIDGLLTNGLLVALDTQPLTSDRGYYLVGTSAFFGSRIGKSLIDALDPGQLPQPRLVSE
ncbi:LysR family transcriptional regulator [Mesorhizobium sp. MSK_1335]|uniref:LysR family transcriptional regulator n=1 Tax=Mesorhizobium montanum TaxID=3072323 RepID=A0ABU4ZVT2_9HYPH|nr:LysR family transcriptional regulator [Mesorhizobium sp. MSK_1335]MDX8528522.1 LysR family transcriptional regulator [Mesorhizobium sp. MSK_1335]